MFTTSKGLAEVYRGDKLPVAQRYALLLTSLGLCMISGGGHENPVWDSHREWFSWTEAWGRLNKMRSQAFTSSVATDIVLMAPNEGNFVGSLDNVITLECFKYAG